MTQLKRMNSADSGMNQNQNQLAGRMKSPANRAMRQPIDIMRSILSSISET